MTTGSVPTALEQQDVYLFPASFAQQRLWLLHRLEPESTAYNIYETVQISGRLEEEALKQSLNALVQRHEALRTTFTMRDGQPMQVISPILIVPLSVVDLQHLPEAQREAETLRLANQEAQRPFDLAHGPLLRTTLFRLGAEDHILLLVVHHSIFDDGSIGVFFGELTALYEAFAQGQAPHLPELPIQYADFAVWQREWLQGKKLEEQLAYWKEQLAGAPAALELPTDHPRPAVPTSRGANYLFSFSKPLTEALKALSRQEGVSLYMTLAASFATLLARYSGQEDLLLGTVVSERRRPEFQGLIGFFLNTLVLRTDLSGNPTFEELLRRVREVTLEAQAHQDVPFEYLVKELRPERSLSQNPLFQVLLTLNPALPPLPAGWTFTSMELETGAAKFELYLELIDRPEGLAGYVEYSTDLFEERSITRMMSHWQTLLEGIVAHPAQPLSALPLLTPAERHQLLVEWNATARAYPKDQGIHQLFEAQVQRTPEAVALVYEEQELSYRALNHRANQLAHHLQQLGVGPEVLVGLYMERSPEMVIGLLGILKAGGAYVPLDPSFPSERLAFMLQDAQAPVVVTQQQLSRQLPKRRAKVVCLDADRNVLAQQSQANPKSLATADNLAYVIYTSGSTGRPKGVQILHRAVVNFLFSMREQPGLSAEDRLLAITTLSFDIAALELFLPLIVGAQLIIGSRDVVTSGPALAETLARHQVTVMQATPVTWRMLLAAGWQGQPELKMLCGGEALPWELAQQLLPKGSALWNLYGPTETTIWSTVCKIKPEDPVVTIGRPIANTQVYILDKQLQLVPIGVAGELYIGGDGLARGYLNRPELTAERFIRHPFSQEPGARLYKTGDLARYRADGTLEHLGRTDFQVKLRGYRIELGEIEAVLAQHPAVREVVVVAREDSPGDQRLVAYLVLHPEQTAPVAELQQQAMNYLPKYMIPSAFVLLEALPLTPNGKVDRKALPAPDSASLQVQGTFVAPRTAVEEMIADTWAQVLGLERVGIHDNFFALGGHSLLAIQVIAQLHARTQVELPLRSFFETPTVAQLAQTIAQLQARSEKSHIPALHARSREAHRVSLAQGTDSSSNAEE